ncbi:DUF3152 domain-containing protein [Streptomyces sp. ME03-5709C]|nr:DUF3152 domain-containing protein [Streptomyces sp. ME03-5709C]
MSASHRAGRHRSTRSRRRPRRRGRGYLVATLVVVGLLGSVAFFLDDGRGEATGGARHQRSTAPATPSPSTSPSPTATPSPTKIDVPATGSGTFVTAQAGGEKVGRGPRPLRYVVKVETGLDISPEEAAAEIADILASPRGWSHNPDFAFQLVGADAPHDLTFRIATAGTADALCWAGIHQDTEGEYNCEVPGGIVVNLKRWVEGSDMFDGPIHDYRALIVNHEMGHFLQYTHTTCAGPGQLAPVMMQQIKGLHRCVANAWPYDKNGHFVTGPHVR